MTDQTPARLPATAAGSAETARVVLEQGTLAVFGALSVVVEVLARGLADSIPLSPGENQRVAAATTGLANTALGLGWWVTRTADRAIVSGLRLAEPVASVVLDPPLVPKRLRPGRLLGRTTTSWLEERGHAVGSFASVSGNVALTAAGVVGALAPPEEVVVRAIRSIDLDVLAEAILAQVDLDRLLAGALDDVAVDDLVQSVIRDVDLEGALVASLERIDITATVLDHLDLPRIVDEALHRLDTTQLVLDNVDVVTLAQAVIDGVDLPQIVRQSSGSIASETVDAVRLQGIDADRAVARMVDRLMRRRPDER